MQSYSCAMTSITAWSRLISLLAEIVGQEWISCSASQFRRASMAAVEHLGCVATQAFL